MGGTTTAGCLYQSTSEDAGVSAASVMPADNIVMVVMYLFVVVMIMQGDAARVSLG